MEANSENVSQHMYEAFDSPQRSGNLGTTVTCVQCQRMISSENGATGDPEATRICGDCKFLFLEDVEAPTQDSHYRRPFRRRRIRYGSSESMEQFSHIANAIRQNQTNVDGQDGQSVDVDARLFHQGSSLTTPIGSRRWNRGLSDTDSEGFDNLDSVNGDIDSIVSFGVYRGFHIDSDAISFSNYGGESDISVFGLLDTDVFNIQPDEESNFDSDTDIDPMHAGLNNWNSDDPEEDEDDAEWHGRFQSSETYITSIFSTLDESEALDYSRNSEYLDATDFGDFLDHLAEADNTRLGAPPAALTYVNSLPRVVVNEEHLKQDDINCAICKDLLCVNTEVIQLPCFHIYHPFCIIPWLSARNSCPLCRYELPTDDKDYEEGKRNNSSVMNIHEIQLQDTGDDSSLAAEADSAQELVHGRIDETGERGGWFFSSAVPALTLIGIALVMWLGNPVTEQRRQMGPSNLYERRQNRNRNTGSHLLNHRENTTRRWWSLF